MVLFKLSLIVVTLYGLLLTMIYDIYHQRQTKKNYLFLVMLLYLKER